MLRSCKAILAVISLNLFHISQVTLHHGLNSSKFHNGTASKWTIPNICRAEVSTFVDLDLVISTWG